MNAAAWLAKRSDSAFCSFSNFTDWRSHSGLTLELPSSCTGGGLTRWHRYTLTKCSAKCPTSRHLCSITLSSSLIVHYTRLSTISCCCCWCFLEQFAASSRLHVVTFCLPVMPVDFALHAFLPVLLVNICAVTVVILDTRLSVLLILKLTAPLKLWRHRNVIVTIVTWCGCVWAVSS